jgi:anthranilate synthase component 1
MLAAVDALLARYRSPQLDELPPLHGGLLGYLGYDVVREVEHLPDIPPDDRGYPDAQLSVIGQLAAFDHFAQRVTLIENVLVPEGASADELDRLYDAAVDRLDQLAADGASPLDEPMVDPPATDDELPAVVSSMGSSLYGHAVEAAKERILDGDIFQVVLAQRFDFDLGADPFDYYRVLRQVNPSPYMYFVRQPGVTLVGCSPEPMVQLLDNRVISRPIAGTRRRGRTDEDDRRLGAELAEHPKEIAEHIMLVDLARNDVGRVVTFGTEQVDEMMTLERYSHVMHLTSQVSGELAEGKTPIDVLRATLPAGTVSGAPKVRAMEIIDELEPVKRGPYAGVVGYIDFSGNIDTAIAIRTLIVDDQGRASVQAGAGIVADSVPKHEDLECRNKAQALLAAVPGARRMTEQRREASSPGVVDTAGRTYAVRLDRDVLRVKGPEALSYLQGQLSQDLDALAAGGSAFSLLLEPDGKLGFWLRVARVADDEYVLDIDAGAGAALRARLERFKLRVQAEIEPLDWNCVAYRGGEVDLAGQGELQLAVDWPDLAGIDVLGPAVDGADGVAEISVAEYEVHRIAAGWPAMGAEITEGRIPAEVGVVDASVSFTKGCYTGQELVARIDSRGGNAPRHLRRLKISGGVPVVGTEVTVDGDVVGELTSVAPVDDGGAAVALAYVKRAVEPPAEGVVRWDGAEAKATIAALPAAD